MYHWNICLSDPNNWLLEIEGFTLNLILTSFLSNKYNRKAPSDVMYTGCPRRNVPDFGRVFLMLKYTDIPQNTYVQSWTVTEIMAREKCGLLSVPRTLPISWRFVLHCFPRKPLSGIYSVFVAPAVEAAVLSESVTYSAWNSRDSYEMVCGFL
jgi:hypothetical protein